MVVENIGLFIYINGGDFQHLLVGRCGEPEKLPVIGGKYIYLSGRYEKPGWEDRAPEQRSLYHCQTMSCADRGADD